MTSHRGALVVVLSLALLSLTTSAGRAAEQDPGYQIGIDDVLGISVWDNADASLTVFVRPDGKISLPLAGEVDVRGMTVSQLESKLEEMYAKTIKVARVTVVVKDIKSRPIFFVGGVGRVGPMQLTQDWTLLQAISAAGGLAPGADLESAYVLRGSTVMPVNFYQLIQKADMRQNIKLQPGDTVVVPLADSVYVQGDVKAPGALKYTKELTLLGAITEAGGFPDLTVPRRVSLVRGEGVKKETVEVNINDMVKPDSPAPDMLLQPKDLIVVTIADLVYVQGEVRAPRTLNYTKDLTMLKAIAQAGGLSNLAAGNRVNLVRGEGAKRESLKVNVEDMMKGAAPDIALKPNDIVIVPQRLF